MRRGLSLVELLFVLTLLALGTASLLPLARRQREVLAVRGARETVVALVGRGRREAVARGGAEVVLRTDPPGGWVEASGAVVSRLDLGALGVEMELGSAGEARLRFDALGLGRAASRTVVLRRGGAEAVLVISSYGRVRRE